MEVLVSIKSGWIAACSSFPEHTWIISIFYVCGPPGVDHERNQVFDECLDLQPYSELSEMSEAKTFTHETPGLNN